MNTQPGLFNQPDQLPRIARVKGTATSHDAAHRVNRNGQRQNNCQLVANQLRLTPGRTYIELAEAMQMDKAEVNRRLCDLKKRGEARQDGRRDGCGQWWEVTK